MTAGVWRYSLWKEVSFMFNESLLTLVSAKALCAAAIFHSARFSPAREGRKTHERLLLVLPAVIFASLALLTGAGDPMPAHARWIPEPGNGSGNGGN